MLLSLFTPTHRPTYLQETYQSILRQEHTDWEWVLVPNGEGSYIPENIQRDHRVRVVTADRRFKGIGDVKQFACNACRGDAFIELDHDDMLMPGDSLSSIARCIEAGAGFVYSDTAVFREDLNPVTWSSDSGWESYPVQVYGRKLQASRCLDLTARSLGEIYYAPDHVRAWSRKAYHRTGGHNPDLTVGDDHDLMIRTYLAGFSFQHTGGCHYLYRRHGGNTVLKQAEQIQKAVAANCRRYFKALVREEAARKQWLDVVDVNGLWEEGWRFERDLCNGLGRDNSAILVTCHDLLQWCEPYRVAEFMNRVYDVLAPGGYVEIRVPSTDGRAAWADPAYRSYFNSATFHTYCRKSLARQNPDIRCRFQYIQGVNHYPSKFHRGIKHKYTTVHLAALKGQRQPGLKHI